MVISGERSRLWQIILPGGLLVCCAQAQDTVTGAFEGTVSNSLTGEPRTGALTIAGQTFFTAPPT